MSEHDNDHVVWEDPDDPEVMARAQADVIEADVALPDGYRATDGGNADRLLALHGDRLRHVAIWRKWVAWDGCRWRIDYGDRMTLGRGRDVVRHLLRVAGEQADPKQAGMIVNFALRTESSRQLRALCDVAASAPSVALDHEQLDADGWLLNLPNGTLDLRTGEVREHRPEDLLTMLAGTTYEPGAVAPHFEAFVERVLPDDEVRSYVQSRLGAALVGEVREHELHVAFGDGANGKTTLFGIISGVLGDYATVAPKTLLVAGGFEHHPTDKTTLFRRRLAFAGEINEGSYFNESLVKELTGGDRITARRMREDFWQFDPTHKLWLFCNHLPHVTGTDSAIWRRVRVVPFDVTIPEPEQDPDLARKVLATEAPGVLAWLIEGCRLWQSGMPAPRAVLLATESYRHGEDTAARFVIEELEVDPDSGVHCVPADELWPAHAEWCAGQGIPEVAVRREVQRVSERLKQQGCDQVRRSKAGKKRTLWIGVRLREDRGPQGGPA